MSTRFKKHTSHNSKPYDRPKTFLQKVASTLHDMFIPSWLLYDTYKADSDVVLTSVTQNLEDNTELSQNLFQINNQKLSDRNEQSRNVYAKNETSKNIYMPERRPTFSSYSNEHERRRKEKSQLSELNDNYEIIQGKSTNLLKNDSLKNIRLQRKSLIQPSFVNGDDHSENSDGSASTSGCSSLVSSHQERKEQVQDYGLQITDEALEHIKKELSKKEEFKNKGEKRHISVETDSVNYGTDSNFNHNDLHSWYEEKIVNPNKRARPQPTFLGRKPSFNLSSFGAPPLGDSSHSSANCCHSPFYEGKTAFGGASALNRSHILSSVPHPNTNLSNTKLKVKDVSSKKDFDYMSTTAKRILLSLEKMSTPLVDAKKIPTEKKTSVEEALKRQNVNFNITTVTTPTTNGPRYQTQLCKPPTTGIIIPSSSMIGKNLESRLSLDKMSSNITHNGAAKTSDKISPPLTSLPLKTVGKIRTRTNTTLHCTKKSVNEIVEVPDLPNIPLPIDHLPTFNFKTLSEPSRESNLSKHNNEIEFKFSSPIEHSAPAPPQSHSSEMSFTFSSPVNKETDLDKPPNNEKLKLENDSFDAKSSDNDEVIPAEQKDKEKSTEQKEKQPFCFDEKFKPPVGSWECSTCLLRNTEAATKCIACEMPKSNITVSTSEISGFSDIKMESNNKILDRSCKQNESENENKNSFSNSPNKVTNSWQEKFKPPPGNWSCPTCLISNDKAVLKCPACETSNPNHKQSAVEQVAVGSFGSKFKPPPGSWECDTCFVQNSNDAIKCIACETSRCVSSKQSDSAQMFSGFKFGSTDKQSSSFSLENTALNNNNNNPVFKFGIIPTSGLSTNSEPQGFTFGNKVMESGSHEGFKFTASNFVTSSSAFTFGGKSLQNNSESTNLTNGKKQFGFNQIIENTQTASFGNKTLSAAIEPSKSIPQSQHLENQSFASKSETSNFVLSKNSISEAALTATTAATMVSVSPSTTQISLSTATTTVSIFNFGIPQSVVSAANNISPPKSNAVINVSENPTNSCSFSFTNPQKVADISNRDNVNPNKVEINNESISTTVSQNPIVSFSFGSGTQETTTTITTTTITTTTTTTAAAAATTTNTATNNVFKITAPSSVFTFGAPVSFSIASTQQNVINPSKNLFTPNTTSQVSFSSFGNKLVTTAFNHDNTQPKQGFGFQSLSDPQFNTPKSVSSNSVFRFGALQEQKPADNLKQGFTFVASQEQKPPVGEQIQKQSFNFNFRTSQSEPKPSSVAQDNCFNFNATKGNDRDKTKSGFNFSFNPSQNIFGTPSTSAPAPTTSFNFAGNVASSGPQFPFTPGSGGVAQPIRKIKRAVRRSALGPGRRE